MRKYAHEFQKLFWHYIELHDYTLDVLGTHLGVGNTYISKWVNGHLHYSAKYLMKTCHFFGISGNEEKHFIATYEDFWQQQTEPSAEHWQNPQGKSAPSIPPGLKQHIINFETLILNKTEGFVGREFVFDALEDFLAEAQSGYFLIRGKPGMGKTAILAQLVKTRNVVHHFNIIQQNIRTPDQFLHNICAQLIFLYHLAQLDLPTEPLQDSIFLLRCLDAASAALGDRPLILTIDALDETDWRALPARVNPLYLPYVLPRNVYIVASYRSDERVDSVSLDVEYSRTLDLEWDSAGNLLDIRRYIAAYAERDAIKTRLVEWNISVELFVEELQRKSEGNFMYLKHVLPAIEFRQLGRGGVGQLPQGLTAYYRGHWAKMQAEVGGTFRATHEAVICVLAVMRVPVTTTQVARWTKLQHNEVTKIIKIWSEFLLAEQIDEDTRYRIYHATFAEFLAKQVDLRDYHRLVALAMKERVKPATRLS